MLTTNESIFVDKNYFLTQWLTGTKLRETISCMETIGRIHIFAGSWFGLWSSFLNRNTDPTWPDFENVYKKTDEQCCRSESKLDPYLTTLWIHVPNLDPDPHLLTNLDTDP